MEKNYIKSFATCAKAFFILLCLQFVCVAASAASPFTTNTTKQIKDENSSVNASYGNGYRFQITKLERKGYYVLADYVKDASKKGGYTVMRIAELYSGRIYNEVPVNSDNASTGTVYIPISDYYFKSGTYEISFVVDGVVRDAKRIELHFK